MRFNDLEARFRALESAFDARLPDEKWIVARLDGRGFTRLTKRALPLEKPFDPRFHDAMKRALSHVCDCGFAVRLAFSQSDEISLLFEPLERGFDGKTRKWLSVLAGETSAAFSLALGQLGAFDCRLLALSDDESAVDYFRWRQSDASRNALSAHAYWLLRSQNDTARGATKRLDGQTPAQKRTWLEAQGVDVAALPLWQTRGVAAHWEQFEKAGLNPRTGETAITMRRRLKIETELPENEEFAVWLQKRLN